MAEALFAADSDPVRTGIRRLIYGGKAFEEKDVDEVVRDVALVELTPRTLSWLAGVYAMARATNKADDVFFLAVDRYPDDFMLNFDFAFMLESQKRWPEAIRYYLRCTALRPDVSGTWRALGYAYRENGEPDRSKESLTQAVALIRNTARSTPILPEP